MGAARRYLTTTEASDTGTSAIEPTTKITPSTSMSTAAATNTPSSASPSAHATTLQRRPGNRPSGNSSGTNSAYASRAVSHVQVENQPATLSPGSPDSAYIPLTVAASTPIGTAQNSQPTALCGSRRAISTPSTVKTSSEQRQFHGERDAGGIGSTPLQAERRRCGEQHQHRDPDRGCQRPHVCGEEVHPASISDGAFRQRYGTAPRLAPLEVQTRFAVGAAPRRVWHGSPANRHARRHGVVTPRVAAATGWGRSRSG